MAEGHAFPNSNFRPQHSINSCIQPEHAPERSWSGYQDIVFCIIVSFCIARNAISNWNCSDFHHSKRNNHLVLFCIYIYLLCGNKDQADIHERGIAVYSDNGSLLIFYGYEVHRIKEGKQVPDGFKDQNDQDIETLKDEKDWYCKYRLETT